MAAVDFRPPKTKSVEVNGTLFVDVRSWRFLNTDDSLEVQNAVHCVRRFNFTKYRRHRYHRTHGMRALQQAVVKHGVPDVLVYSQGAHYAVPEAANEVVFSTHLARLLRLGRQLGSRIVIRAATLSNPAADSCWANVWQLVRLNALAAELARAFGAAFVDHGALVMHHAEDMFDGNKHFFPRNRPEYRRVRDQRGERPLAGKLLAEVLAAVEQT